MRRLAPWSVFAIVLVLGLIPGRSSISVGASPVAQPGTNPPVLVAILDDMPLGEVLHELRPDVAANDRGFLFGTIGTDLWRARTDPPNEFYMVGDRGPNGQIRVDGVNRRTFPVPDWTPLIARVRVTGAELHVLEIIPITDPAGAWVSGLSNIPGVDEVPYDYTAMVEIPYNPNGLDTEGIVRTSRGDFWLVDEYSPSLVHVDATGKVVARYVPAGLNLQGTTYPVIEAFPPIYTKRKINRGFEGLTMSGDERTLYIALQSPLLNPDTATGNASRQTRILVWDIAAARVTAEFVYRFDESSAFMGRPTAPDEMKISGLAWVNPTTLLVLERTDLVAKIYQIDLSVATNILGTAWNDPATTPTLESLADPASAGVTLLPKTLVIDLSKVSGMPDKIEGVAIVDATTLAVANDNDSDIGDFDADGNNQGVGLQTRLLYVRLERPLPL